jgi:hypothetical protein
MKDVESMDVVHLIEELSELEEKFDSTYIPLVSDDFGPRNVPILLNMLSRHRQIRMELKKRKAP